MNGLLWEKLQNSVKTFKKEKWIKEKTKDFNTMLDMYGLYVAPKLNKKGIEKEMMRAAKKGKERCKLL